MKRLSEKIMEFFEKRKEKRRSSIEKELDDTLKEILEGMKSREPDAYILSRLEKKYKILLRDAKRYQINVIPYKNKLLNIN